MSMCSKWLAGVWSIVCYSCLDLPVTRRTEIVIIVKDVSDAVRCTRPDDVLSQMRTTIIIRVDRKLRS